MLNITSINITTINNMEYGTLQIVFLLHGIPRLWPIQTATEGYTSPIIKAQRTKEEKTKTSIETNEMEISVW